MDIPKISCVLIEKGPQYPIEIFERLELGIFDEIIIKVDCPNVYGRYLAAAKANNDIIFVQDSDCLVNHQVLFNHYNGQITNAMPKDFQEKYKDWNCTLIGWGAFFPKSMLSVFDKYIERYGAEDEHLLREADRIFTYLNRPFNTITMPHEDLFQDEDRMGKDANHYLSMRQALEKCQALIL